MWEKIKEKLLRTISCKSLKARIFIIMIAVGMIPSILLQYGILNSYEDRAVSLRISDVQNQMKIIADHLLNYNYLQDTSSEVINAELDQISNLYNGRVLIINSNFRIVKDTYGISEGKTIISEEVIKCFKGESISNYDKKNGYIELTTPIMFSGSAEYDNPKTGKIQGVMLTSVSTDSIAATLDILGRKAIILQILICVVILGGAAVLSNILVRPFNRLTDAIKDIKEGYTEELAYVPDYAETIHIVDAFNQVLARMKQLNDSRQEFVANVSHELKTPITSVKVLADSLIAQEDVPAELYKEFMEDIAAEIDRENKIINDLLALVKMDKTAADLNISAVNINELTEIILKRLRPIARKRDIEVVFESIRQVTAEVDEVKMTLVITNLVENAIKYNKEQGSVKVVLDADHQFFMLKVSDTGIGIPEESMDHIYERFYRVDKSHSREIGGTGLGLAITRSAVLMHRGSIKLTSVENEGTTFDVKIPLNYIA
ncbi:MAG: two-component sensor histidine kinase [Lachnospiraceae bacterium]|nr:two-component sensor histidine kinase [Lachnospiraceae bacterium]